MKFKNKVLCIILMLFAIHNGTTCYASSPNDVVPKGYAIDMSSGGISIGEVKSYEDLLNFNLKFGNPEASIKITDYSSFECIYCYQLHTQIKNFLISEIEAGNIYYEFKHVSMDKFKYDGYIFRTVEDLDLNKIFDIFEEYPNWSQLKSYTQVNDMLNLGDIKLERVIAEQNVWTELNAKGIRSVPTFEINGKRYTADKITSLEDFKKIVEESKNEIKK